MSRAKKNAQQIIEMYQRMTGKNEFELDDVAEWAISNGYWKAPPPQSPKDILSRRLSQAARQERRPDPETGRPYRPYFSATQHGPEGRQTTLWYDIDHAPRKAMLRSVQERRTGMINDGVQLKFDIEHYNSVNPGQEPIEVDLDLAMDVDIEINARDIDQENKGDAAE